MLLLKKEVLERLKRSTGLRGRLCAELNIAYSTMQRWVEENNLGLTYATSIKIIREAYNLTGSQMLEEVEPDDRPIPYRKKRMTAKKKRKHHS